MTENKGRFYFPKKLSIALALIIVLLIACIAYALSYSSTMKSEQIQRLERINQLTNQSISATRSAITRLTFLGENQTGWNKKYIDQQVANFNASLDKLLMVDDKQILANAIKQNEDYNKAQKIIANSPFKGMKEQQIPLTDEGKQYLEAIKAVKPPRFDYQRLEQGINDYQGIVYNAFRLQEQAEKFTHQIDVKLNGDKANAKGDFSIPSPTETPVTQEAVTEQTPVTNTPPKPVVQPEQPKPQVAKPVQQRQQQPKPKPQAPKPVQKPSNVPSW